MKVHETIVEFMYAVKSGAWDFDTLYNLPIQLRNYHFKKVSSLMENESSKMKKNMK